MTFRVGSIDPQIDVRGVDAFVTNKTLSEEPSFFGAALSGQTGAAASIVAGAGAGQMRLTGLTGMTAASRGRFLTITGAASGGNNGTFYISLFNSATSVDVINGAAVVPDANNGSISWTEREPYVLQDNMDFISTDRRLIKGTTNWYDAVPTYTRPDATGTPVPANLTNIATKTLDAKAMVNDVRQIDTKLRPSISGTAAGTNAGAVTASSNTFETDDFNFTADDLNSFIVLVFDGTATHGGGSLVYRISAVTDGDTLTLEGLGADVTGTGTVSWSLHAGLKAITSSANHADSVNTTGIPIADTGAFDVAAFDATFADVINPLTNGGLVNEASSRIFARSYGDEKNPNGMASDGVRFYAQLLTGPNTAGATVSTLEIISGRTGAAASVTNASVTVTGLTGMQNEDVGKYLSIWGCDVDGNQRHARIVSVVSATSVTVSGANFATDANSGALSWAVSRHPGNFDFYTGFRERMDQVPESRSRGMLIGGIVSDAELALDISQVRDAVGIGDGISNLSGLLTNTGAFYCFNNLPDATPSVVEALNTLNTQIGIRDYTGTILTDGQTITASLQALANAIAGASIERTIERLSSIAPSGTPHTLPGGLTYTLDGAFNGRNMWVFWRRQLRDPGPSSVASNEYEETSTTSITPYSNITSGETISYMIAS